MTRDLCRQPLWRFGENNFERQQWRKIPRFTSTVAKFKTRGTRVASACVAAENTSTQLCDRVKSRDASTETRLASMAVKYGWRMRSRCRLCRDSFESLGNLAATRAQCDYIMRCIYRELHKPPVSQYNKNLMNLFLSVIRFGAAFFV